MALIMVADDAPDILELLKEVLQARGHQVVTVSDGIQMVEKAKAWRPHLIIADLMMPGTYGSAAYKTLQEDPLTAKIPVIFLTAVPEDKARKVIPEASGVSLLLKPIEIQTLLEAVNAALARGSPPADATGTPPG